MLCVEGGILWYLPMINESLVGGPNRCRLSNAANGKAEAVPKMKSGSWTGHQFWLSGGGNLEFLATTGAIRCLGMVHILGKIWGALQRPISATLHLAESCGFYSNDVSVFDKKNHVNSGTQ